MEAILTNATDAQLAASVEENLFALFRAVTALPGSEIVETERLSYHDTLIPGGMFKAAWNAHLPESEMDAAIEQTLAYFKTRRAPLFSWWFNQRAPESFVNRLQAHGLQSIYDAPGMALDLTAITLRLPDGFTIVEARDAHTLADWTNALYESYLEYEMPMSAARIWADATLALGDSAPWRVYVGYDNGQPVATNLVFNGAGISGLFCVGTIPAARGKGFGAAITLQPLLDARAEGYRYGVLFASDMGLPMYRKVGFREVPIVIRRYGWHAD